ncbi:MAG: DUF2141 domain-containing protein [Tunicatimonas sp.]
MTYLLFLITLAWLPPVGPPAANTLPMSTHVAASLTIDVSGVKQRKGKLQVALYNSDKDFPETEPYRGEVLNITADNDLKITFKDLPPGDYAVAVYHDKNSNGKLDKNLLGVPVEDYGFSNDTRGTRLSAPSFDNTKLRVDGENVELKIEVR